MASNDDPSSYKAIRLGDELRSLRTEANETLKQTAGFIQGWDAARLSKVERAKMPISLEDLGKLLKHFKVTRDEREELLSLLRDGPSIRWWREYENIPPAFAEYLALEAEASETCEYFPSGFPGMVQTEDYAKEMIEAGIDGPSEEQVEASVEVRKLRQRRLTEEPRLVHEAYFGELALLVTDSERVLAEQIRYAIKVAESPNVTLRMVPFSAGRGGILSSGVVLLRFPGGPEAQFAFVEDVSGMLPRRSGREVRRCQRAVARVRGRALSPEATIAALERRLGEIS
jgi:transcriptional regulator with XRE-family HTH domain